MALHLEDARQPVADVDDAGVFAGALNDPRRLRRQLAQMQARGLVGAMLVPHRREDAEFRDRRLAADQRENALVFVRLQAVFGHKLRRHLRFIAQQVRFPCVWAPPGSGDFGGRRREAFEQAAPVRAAHD